MPATRRRNTSHGEDVHRDGRRSVPTPRSPACTIRHGSEALPTADLPRPSCPPAPEWPHRYSGGPDESVSSAPSIGDEASRDSHRSTVSGCTTTKAVRHSRHPFASRTQKSRSLVRSFGRATCESMRPAADDVPGVQARPPGVPDTSIRSPEEVRQAPSPCGILSRIWARNQSAGPRSSSGEPQLWTDARFSLRASIVLASAVIVAACLSLYGLIVLRTIQEAPYLESHATNLPELFLMMRGQQFADKLFMFDARTILTAHRNWLDRSATRVGRFLPVTGSASDKQIVGFSAQRPTSHHEGTCRANPWNC
jgi:hypothetical protein